jgi:hypothetical protein
MVGTVIPHLFSGRPNPEWQLTATQMDTWQSLWEAAISSDIPIAPLHNLGYTGCKLQTNREAYWFVVNGLVGFYAKQETIFKKDTDAVMELFLLNTAPNEVKTILQKLDVI